MVDSYLRTTNPAVWAIGDAAGGMMQTPVANLEGRTVRGISGAPRGNSPGPAGGPARTRVEIVSKKAMETNIFAPDWAQEILDKLGQKLR